ncbi:MAG: superoxide dismutase [Candidatus Magasanikbacteria bacterium CG10_big_fil_rev_8_21_14_0_10_40_10]|uniref:superoxide dismutase n=1 Tax=Candidatus Magasanikbacteria bacterium CG10_big_fil_rev_8_21_14_0_10_40_10 TaxID=1974648 RepID=A0A2M6W4B1_9BACT|nr:MAG: superoxide dismutase [Candidatus Magasanikbacteria bacterium CG10_big_fil_rev_8_21_14_0_10_40_10]
MYQAINFDSLQGLNGFSDKTLETHFKLYAGYVANTNKLASQLSALETGSPEYAELKRRFGWEFDGMRLHEYYFEALTKTPTPLATDSSLYKKITKQFGDFASWQKDFIATAMTRGIGWTILYYDKKADQLFNVWINEHDVGHLAGCAIILNLDVFEHAFMLDYGTDRAKYIDVFFQAINWSEVKNRLE